MSVHGVIFDLDGTLADTLADLTDAVNAGLAHLGHAPRQADEVRLWIGEGMMLLCRRAMAAATGKPEKSIDQAAVASMAAAFTNYYHDHRLDKTASYPGIPQLLDELTALG
ncbi:MAG TPA: HAD hydrolase-like protein, partial [Phycisphaerae bacterium]|nr:HAD hydrolase-like protein [Phycisphaerae bacterium]